MHYLLSYEKALDHAQREPPHQAAHRDHVRSALSRGELVLGGPLLDPADGSNMLLFRADSASAVEKFAKTDPYVTGGIITRWHIRPWQTVCGKGAECLLPDFKVQ
ncbi:MAG TPA: YciI family protein [Pirellulales bacterium]|jgi:hypothetical protein|nr:YciI family protein [Pirellulales bacterium]